ncbi:peptidoglycan-binding protein [Priestia aryabhattai]|uniref:peptidoglycan-binding domain-containing protein n=1 Tax=Priestia aryabhattai TaxID=412384 RepID=UPI00399F7071
MRNFQTGFLNVTVNGINPIDPIPGAKVTITEYRNRDKIIKTLETNEVGQLNLIELEAASPADINSKKYDMIVEIPPIKDKVPNGKTYVKSGIEIKNGLTVNSEDDLSYITALEDTRAYRNILEINIPDNNITQPEVKNVSFINPYTIPDKILTGGLYAYPAYVQPFIPSDIKIHLGFADPFNQLTPVNERNIIQENYKKYLKIVCAQEFGGMIGHRDHPLTEQAMIAFILCVNSFALNRIYTELYINRGYKFNITNSTRIDQHYPPGRTTYDSIDTNVELYFNKYVRIKGKAQPLLTAYCRGESDSCFNHGIPQIVYNTLSRNNPQLTYFDLLNNFFTKEGVEIEVVEASIVPGLPAGSYPGSPLRLNMQDTDGKDYIKTIQRFLNVIRHPNFIGIPKTQETGIFDEATFKAVKKFQELFLRNIKEKGIVDEVTWYKIAEKYVFRTKIYEPVIPGNNRHMNQPSINHGYLEWVPAWVPTYKPMRKFY